MIPIGIPLILLGGLIGFWAVRKKGVLVSVVAGIVCGGTFVGLFVLTVVLGGDH